MGKAPRRNDINIIIKRTAEKLDIPEDKVLNVIRSLFGYISGLVEKGNWEGFYLRFFGKFVVKPLRLETMQKRLEKRMNKDSIEIKDSKEENSFLDEIVNDKQDETSRK